MAVLLRFTGSLLIFVSSLRGASFAEETRDHVGLEIQCGEVDVKITAKRQFFEERRVPFTPEHLRLGAKSTLDKSCEPNGQMSDRGSMVISAGLRECGTESSVGDGQGHTQFSQEPVIVGYMRTKVTETDTN